MSDSTTSSIYADVLSDSSAAEEASSDAYDEYGYEYGVDEFNTEEYASVGERGFVSTQTSPLSTVSADVDTASYCNIRRMIGDGYAVGDIPSGAVRIEEMLNYFHYDYDLPAGSEGDDDADNADGDAADADAADADSGDASERFAITARAGQCPWNEDSELLVLGFSAAPESEEAHERSNLVFLIDVSGSMGEQDKLPLLQDSFATLVESLDEGDIVSIVTYAGTEEVVLDGASGADREAILRAIYRLDAEGSTNGEAGLEMAYELAARHYIDGGVNRIVMASDGDLNVGMTSESDLYDYVEAKRETGIYLSVLGFGSGNYKDNKMETLADHGNGSYHYIDCSDEAVRVLRDQLCANLVPFADDVKVQIEFNPAQVKAYRLIGYENRELNDEDFDDDTVDAGDVGPGSQFTVAYEVVLVGSDYEVPEIDLKYSDDDASDDGDAKDAKDSKEVGASDNAADDVAAAATDSAFSSSADWATCSLRYRSFDMGETVEQEEVVDADDYSEDPASSWKQAAAVIEYAMILRDSDYVGTSTLDGVAALIAQCRSATGADEGLDGFAELVGATRLGSNFSDDDSDDDLE